MDNKNKLPKPNNLQKAARLSGVAVQMGVTFYLAVYFGNKLDLYFENEKKIVTLIFVILATFISIYSILQQLKKIQE